MLSMSDRCCGCLQGDNQVEQFNFVAELLLPLSDEWQAIAACYCLMNDHQLLLLSNEWVSSGAVATWRCRCVSAVVAVSVLLTSDGLHSSLVFANRIVAVSILLLVPHGRQSTRVVCVVNFVTKLESYYTFLSPCAHVKQNYRSVRRAECFVAACSM